jgi:hypothetical protein
MKYNFINRNPGSAYTKAKQLGNLFNFIKKNLMGYLVLDKPNNYVPDF